MRARDIQNDYIVTMSKLSQLQLICLWENGRNFAGGIFRCIFLNESVSISTKGPINNIPVLVLIMAWSRPGVKPLS